MDTEPGLALLEQLESDTLSDALANLPDADINSNASNALSTDWHDWPIEHAEPRPIAPITDIHAAAQVALTTPLASLRLAELCGEATRAAIVLGVASVELAQGLLLPVIDEMRTAGTLAQNINVLVATAQQADGLRAGLAERAKIIINAPDDVREQDELGNVNGVSLAVNYRASEADVLIAITAVQSDLFATYTNAATTLIHTAASSVVQNELHAPRYLSDAADWHGRVQELPYQRLAEEAARRAGLRFALSALVDEQGDVLAVKAGEPMAVNESLLPVAQSAREADVSRDDYDVAFLDVAAEPQSLFQASAAATNLGNLTTSPMLYGGLLVLQAERGITEADPLAAQNFYDVMAQGGEADGVLQLLNRRALKPGEDRAYLLAKAMAHYRVMVVGHDMDDLARTNYMLSAQDMREAADLAETLTGHRPHALSIARASYTLPVFNSRLAEKNDEFMGEIDWIGDLNLKPIAW